MKLKALKNIDGIVKAYAGQEFEVQNQQLAKDLIQQGVAYSTDTQGTEVENLLKVDGATLEAQSEVEAIERTEYERAFSGTIQEEANKMSDQKQTKIEEIKQRAQQNARQKAQQSQQKQPQQSEYEQKLHEALQTGTKEDDVKVAQKPSSKNQNH